MFLSKEVEVVRQVGTSEVFWVGVGLSLLQPRFMLLVLAGAALIKVF